MTNRLLVRAPVENANYDANSGVFHGLIGRS